MFFLNQKKAKITSFEIRGDKLLYLSDKNLYVDSILLRGQDVCCFVCGLKERIIFSSWDSVIYTFTNNKIISLLEGYSLSEKKYSEDKIIISQRVSRGVFNKFVFDLSTGSILKKIDAEPSFISLSSEIFTIATTLKSLSLLTGEYEWEVDLGAYCTFVQDNETRQGNINSIIGVHQEQLWLMCSNRRLLGLCIHTGKTLSNVWLGDLRSELQNLVVLSPPIIDEANNQFIFCTYQYYFTINADTLTLSIFHKIPFEGRADNIQTQTIYNNLVYFTGQHYLPNSRYESQVGVYDPINNAILWTYGINEIINQVPQVTENKLYILDTGGTLHIFEKE